MKIVEGRSHVFSSSPAGWQQMKSDYGRTATSDRRCWEALCPSLYLPSPVLAGTQANRILTGAVIS